MAKRIYTFEVDTSDDSFEDRDLYDIGLDIAKMASKRTGYDQVIGVEKVTFIDSHSETEWDKLIYGMAIS